MARTPNEYLRLLQSLLPEGFAWNRNEDSILTKFISGEVEEFARVDERSDNLLLEKDTRYASELLIDHEIDLGLPDSCSLAEETITERQRTMHSKLIALGQQDSAYFIELAAAYGWTITITEYTPFWCGLGVAGDPCGDQETIFYWKITIAYGGGDIVYFQCGNSQCGDSLAFIPGTTSLLCMLNKYKPAHTTLIFDYTGASFSVAFGLAFDSLPSDQEDYLEGAFWHGFGSGFDVHYGGGFDIDAYGDGFRHPV